ncbi:MAG: hypothetical protein IKN07_01380 [Lachnospiraceae bacterium]|nr:hypothetical protein [Lachnospiraceae bacterium]MBR6357790.1 hypothetical protein [Lachnospiraceae bacterium]
MNDIIMKIIIVFMTIMGAGSSFVVVVGIPATIIYKLIRMTKGYKITD